ncbi:MAG: hypothetical protein WC532_06660 [Candidatus Omnitrophota bacterium]
MDENLATVLLIKKVSFFIGLGGLVFGLDAVLGAHITSAISHFLSKTIDLDKFFMGHPKRRISLGIAFLIVSLMAFLVKVW